MKHVGASLRGRVSRTNKLGERVYYGKFEPRSMIVEKRRLVTNEPFEVQDCRKITDYFKRIYGTYPNFIKKNRRMST
jgi:hypothetical protein